MKPEMEVDVETLGSALERTRPLISVDKRQLGLFGADQLPLDQQNKFGQLGLSFRALCTIRSGDLNHPGRCCGRGTPKMTRVESDSLKLHQKNMIYK